MKNDESKHTNGTLIKLLLKRTPPPRKKFFADLSEGRDPPDGVQYLFPRK